MTAVLFWPAHGEALLHTPATQLRLPRSLALHHLRGAGLMQPARIKRLWCHLRTIVDEQLVAFFEWSEIAQYWKENLIAVTLVTQL